MKLIPLTQGKFAMVDDEDFERVNQFKWYALKKRNVWYAERSVWSNNKHICNIKMHQFIVLDNPLKLPIDHIDMDGLNNQGFNMRLATIAQNGRNRTGMSGKTSKYKGVCFDRFRGKWVATIKIYGKKKMKRFDYEIDAAKQYDIWAMELFGEFAWLNFPPTT